MLKRFVAYFFFLVIAIALVQCAKRGNPTGGPKDITPPVLVKSTPDNMSTQFKATKIRLYFDELIKLQDVQEQLIISPPLKYNLDITPQGGAAKYVEIKIKDTLKPNTTYTINFGQSIQDNNEGNPNSFLTYIFSTGDYIDSLQVSGVVKDAFNKQPDTFISVLLYEIDSTYTDSTLYKKPPNYITNTLDSTIIFTLKNLKKGKYAIFALKDESKNNIFDQKTDKIAFLKDTVSLPTDSTYLLKLFKEIPDYGASVPSYAAKNKIVFGYYGENKDISIQPLTVLPDTIKTKILKEKDKDTLNFWLTPFETDSIIFTVTNERLKVIDTFTVKTRKVGIDSLKLEPNQRGSLAFNTPFYISANTPLTKIDTSKIQMMNKDSIPLNFGVHLDSIENQADFKFDFDVEANENYAVTLLPGAITDFFGQENDTTSYRLSTKSLADYGNLRMDLTGNITYPIIVQLTNQKGETLREFYATEPRIYDFSNINPATYQIRVIFDTSENGKWDTGNYLKNIQPEKVIYYPDLIEVRANWELEQTFNISN